MRPSAIIARWLNEESTIGFHLQADGQLSMMERSHPSHVWSPPIKIGAPSSLIGELKQLFDLLTEDEISVHQTIVNKPEG